ncbi:hypothetical protein PspLS_03226 [Pyricularia sp. CBS 133598]|nr:hypothetical protein PspLS_03226 [Pyricularia sp. CBS 133598]
MQAEVLEPPEILTYQTRKQPSSCLQPRSYPSVRSSGLLPCTLEGRERKENHPSNDTCNNPSGYY